LGAVKFLLRAQLRHRWQPWLVMAILVSVVAGVVLASAAAGRRTQRAFPGYVAAHGFDAEIYAFAPQPRLAHLPEVQAITEEAGPTNGRPTCACKHPINPSDLSVVIITTSRIAPYRLVSGRMPDPSNPNEVLASFTLQKDVGLRLGSVVRVPFYTAAQEQAENNATGAPPEPLGPTVPFRVVGFEASEVEFPFGSTPSYLFYATPALAHKVLPNVGWAHIYLVRLRHGAADIARLSAAVNPRQAYVGSLDAQVAAIEASIHPQAIGWWLLAGLAALVGMAVVGQALRRQSISESEVYPTMAALGLGRRELVMLGMARNLLVGLAGAVGAIVIAALLSPLAPLGEARVALSSSGINFEPLVLPLGAVITVILVFCLGLWPVVQASRVARSDVQATPLRPSLVVNELASAGAPPSAIIGVRNALERRVGGTKSAAPVGSALLGTVLAVVALCGTAVFGTSLSHLTATPRLYGDPFDLNISNSGPNGGPDPTLLKSLMHNRAVTGITQGIALPALAINNVTVGAIAGAAIKGPLLISTVKGHLPDAPGQVGLGVTTLRQVGGRLGSTVRVTVMSPSGQRRTVPFRIVSVLSLPVLGNAVSLGSGALFTLRGYEDAACAPSPRQAFCRDEVAHDTNGGMLVQFVSGPRRQASINYYFDRYKSIVALAVTPTSLVNFGEAVNFPLIFGAILAVFGAATLLHLLVVSVSRRRRDVGLLKAVGFVNSQVASTVLWQSTTLAVIGITVGVPLGVLVGKAVWTAFANNLGVIPISVVPGWLIALLAAAVLVAANVIAVVPALAATRSNAADLLRTA
jgi:hypothetical protein